MKIYSVICEDGSPDPSDRVVAYPDGSGEPSSQFLIRHFRNSDLNEGTAVCAAGQEAISGKQKEVSSRSLHWEQAQSTLSFLHLMPLSVVHAILQLPPHLGHAGDTTS